MTIQTEAAIVVTLDKAITKLDQVLDELELVPDKEISRAEHLIMQVTMELTDLIDKVTEDAYKAPIGNA